MNITDVHFEPGILLVVFSFIDHNNPEVRATIISFHR